MTDQELLTLKQAELALLNTQKTNAEEQAANQALLISKQLAVAVARLNQQIAVKQTEIYTLNNPS